MFPTNGKIKCDPPNLPKFDFILLSVDCFNGLGVPRNVALVGPFRNHYHLVSVQSHGYVAD